MIANDVVAFLKENELFSMAEAVNPGFINLKIASAFLTKFLNEMQADENLSIEKKKHQRRLLSIMADQM